jgi:Questin oxidase-like
MVGERHGRETWWREPRERAKREREEREQLYLFKFVLIVYLRLYTDYLDFFDGEVDKYGIKGAVDKYFFLPELFGRFFTGVHHCVIHLGYPRNNEEIENKKK